MKLGYKDNRIDCPSYLRMMIWQWPYILWEGWPWSLGCCLTVTETLLEEPAVWGISLTFLPSYGSQFLIAMHQFGQLLLYSTSPGSWVKLVSAVSLSKNFLDFQVVLRSDPTAFIWFSLLIINTSHLTTWKFIGLTKLRTKYGEAFSV